MIYKVIWEIDIEADSAVEAAEIALEIQRDPTSEATIFDVSIEGEHWEVDCTNDTVVDLLRTRE